MKFGKEFKSQMVTEWEEAYMNYDYLKTLLKDIHDFNHKHKPHPTAPTLKRTMTLYRTFSGLTRRSDNLTSHGDIEDQVILVTVVDHEHNHHPQQLDKNLDHRYETKFLMSSEKGAEYELVYFRRLYDEFNKVNKFYKSKVEEVMREADLLNKQMDALISLRIKIENPDGTNHHFVNWPMTKLASDVAASAAAVSQTSPRVTSPQTNSLLSPSRSNSRSSNVSRMMLFLMVPYIVRYQIIKSKLCADVDAAMPHMDAIKEIEQSLEEQSEESGDDVVLNGTRVISSTSTTVSETKAKKMDVSRPASIDVLDRVTINNTLETPRSTIKGILNVSKNNDIVFGRENLQKVELQLQRAFVEFYQKLRLLKSYSFLNVLEFSKIMKKYDKITSRNASKSYLHMVDNSYIGSYDGVTRLMERVEATFIKHFTNANRCKGIRILRPAAKRERHRTTFSLGFFAGCALALLASLILIVRARNILGTDGSTIYMETLFPLYSLFGFIVLHMLMYAINIYAWRRYRVNYPFIFGFKQGTELGYREVFLISSALATLALASVLANLDMEMNKHTQRLQDPNRFVFLVTVCPFNIVYRSSRYFLLVCFFHCICAPFYKVLLPDFFLADQLTSQVQAIRSIEYYICYYGGRGFKSRDSSCKKTGVFKVFNFIIASIPYSFRLFQCLRRLFEEKDRMQGYNALKYFSTIVAVAIRAAYKLNDTTAWIVLALLSSIISAVVSTYWDIVIDWGLFQSNSRNRFLRDKLLVPQQNVYFGAIVLNILLRFAWLQSIFDFKLPFLHMEAMVTIFACLEIIRRGMWNFFRLENEGKYRAFKSVPLPFNYDEDDDDKDE
ncbi:hypothetical protein MKW92_041197 [Papaver armeniacum]|nr:hypothetical protein MKW92_041197 [Papaver armeniacum]